jgi:Kinesin-associated protein (KAP)
MQITFTFSKLLGFAPTRRCLLANTEIVHYLVDLLQDKNKEARSRAHMRLLLALHKCTRACTMQAASCWIVESSAGALLWPCPTHVLRARACNCCSPLSSAQVRKHADKAVEVLLDTEPTEAAAIRELKFRTFNQEWLEVVERSDSGGDSRGGSPHTPPPGAGSRGGYDDEDDMGGTSLADFTFMSPQVTLPPPAQQQQRLSLSLDEGDGAGDVELPEDEGNDEDLAMTGYLA